MNDYASDNTFYMDIDHRHFFKSNNISNIRRLGIETDESYIVIC
jgi:hypothetical protein